MLDLNQHSSEIGSFYAHHIYSTEIQLPVSCDTSGAGTFFEQESGKYKI